ncbi:hypothetical protein PFISCL1PPCAC_18226, partial [Pristionchus fissidentatus]
ASNLYIAQHRFTPSPNFLLNIIPLFRFFKLHSMIVKAECFVGMILRRLPLSVCGTWEVTIDQSIN